MPTYPYQTGRVLEVGTKLRFTVKSPQHYHDGWRHTDRTCRFYGPCAYCSIWTYAFDDGENDPRGVLGDHAASPFTFSEHVSEDEAAELARVHPVPTMPACFGCMNDYDRYQWFMDKARRQARSRGADV
jgi:hypothetical protein